jgi:hypothetical protein
VLGVRDVLAVAQRLPHRVALGGEEREAHRSADQHSVGDLQETVDHGDLVRHLGAPDNRNQRVGGALQDGVQCVYLAFE